MASVDVPEEYMDVLLQEFAYDPIRLPPAEDSAQLLYNRRTLETIWISKREACNPYTRQPFHIKNVIPQTNLRQEMWQYIIPDYTDRMGTLKVIPDYTKVLNESGMRYMLNDLVFRYCCFSQKNEKQEDDWKVLWQMLNLIRLYCQYKEENKDLFLLIKGYEYLFQVIDTDLVNSVSECYYKYDDAKEVCRELVRIVDIIGLKQSDLETIPANSVQAFVYILFNLADSNYLKMESMILNIYCQMFYHGIGYAVENKGTFGTCVLLIALKSLVRENTRDITDEDLQNGTSILQAAWICKRDVLLNFQDFVDVIVKVVLLCISRFRDDVAAAPHTRLERASITSGIALARGLKLIHCIATAEGPEGSDKYVYEKERLHRLDIVADIVRMLELVVAGLGFRPVHVRVGLNIIIGLCKPGVRVISRQELRVLTDLLGSNIVNRYGGSVKMLLLEITNSSLSGNVSEQRSALE